MAICAYGPHDNVAVSELMKLRAVLWFGRNIFVID